MVSRGRIPLALVVFAGGVALSGCEEAGEPHRYGVLIGRVVSCDAESGELTVLVEAASKPAGEPDRVYCVITKDSELYVNDRFSALSDFREGDLIEVVGYREPDRRLESFVVGYACVERPEPAAPPPDWVAEALGGTRAADAAVENEE